MKKVTSIVIAVSLVAFVACKKEEAPAPAPKATPTPAPTPAQAPTDPAAVRAAELASNRDATKNILQTAKIAGNFNTLLTVIEAAGLTETLNGPGAFTVFAPTDAAFAKIPKAELDALLADKAKLTAVLTYHVVPGNKLEVDITGAKEFTSVQGGTLAIDNTSGVKVGGATITTFNIITTNGTIHAIDTVLMPKL